MVRMGRLMVGSSTCAVVWTLHGGEKGELHCLLHLKWTPGSHPILVMVTCMDSLLVLGEMSSTEELEGHLSQPSEHPVRNERERCQHAHGVHSMEVCLELEDLCSLESHRLVTPGCSRGEA